MIARLMQEELDAIEASNLAIQNDAHGYDDGGF
jgi:hypothetical protein